MIEPERKDIPPGLLRILKGGKPSKKFYLLLGISFFLVVSGFGSIYFYSTYFTKEIKDQPIPPQNDTQNSSQPSAQTEKTEFPKETNKAESLKNPQSREIKASEKLKLAEENQENRDSLKIAKKTESRDKMKETLIGSIETYKGADFLYRAMDFEQKGLFADAINEYKEYINFTGKADDKILNKISTLYFLMGYLKEADYYAELAYKSNKNSKELLINYGAIKAKLGELDKAEEFFTKALKLDPNNRNALYNLALVKEQKGENREAFKLYQRLYELGDLSVSSSLERLKDK